MIPYGRHTIDKTDIDAIINVLEENDLLTCGKYVLLFENKVCEYVGVKYGVAVNSGTAALHLAINAIGINEDDEIIVPAISFVASANCVLYEKGKPIFCDIDPNTLNIDIKKIEKLITEKTKAILFVDMCGQPCDFDEIKVLADKYNLITIQDAAHSIGAKYKNQKVGSYADITCFSFHPVKTITTGEGGMMITNNKTFYNKAKTFRTHGISRDFKEREKIGSYYYEMQNLGFNYRIPDILCALGISQLDKLDKFIVKRNEIANKYNNIFAPYKNLIEPLTNKYDSAYHLYIIKINNRDTIYQKLKELNIETNVHYLPIYLHPYYKQLGYKKGLCPNAEKVYEQILTIPIYPLLTDNDINYIANSIIDILSK